MYRKAIRYSQKFAAQNDNFVGMENAKIIANPPIENIYQFEGRFEAFDGNATQREPLSLENTLWGSTVLASGRIYAMVLYTGAEMRVVMNSREPRSKVGKLDLEVNFLSKILFAVMVGLSVLLVSLDGFAGMWYIHLFRFIILLSAIIPISLRVNLDFAKLYYSAQINKDQGMKGTIARNRNIPEDLGRIQFLLTDKTGTITQNQMIFKKLSLETGVYTFEMLNELKRILKRNCEKVVGPLSDVEEKMKAKSTENILSAELQKRKNYKREREFVIRDMITALVLCHNVTPVIDNGARTFQASSPDEIALVQIAEGLNMKLSSRDQNEIIIENAIGQQESYEILANFPFSSETKRMGIILRNKQTGRTVFYLKGADTIMKDKVNCF